MSDHPGGTDTDGEGEGDGDGSRGGDPDAGSSGGRDPAGGRSFPDRELAVDADLTIGIGGDAGDSPPADGGPADRDYPDSVEVWSEDSTVTVDASSVGALRSLATGARWLPVDPDFLQEGLSASGVTVRVRLRHATVAVVEPGADPGRLGAVIDRLAGGDVPARVSLRGLVVGGLRRLF